jgi:hypothetical protein
MTQEFRAQPGLCGREIGPTLQPVDRVPPQAAALIVAEHLKVIICQNLIEGLSVCVIKRLRCWCVLAVVNDQPERPTPKFVRHRRPIAIDSMPDSDGRKSAPHTGVPVENSAPGIEAKSFHIANAHGVAIPIRLTGFPLVCELFLEIN